MAKCLACSEKVSIVGDLLKMRQNFQCRNCGSEVKVKPTSVLFISILNALIVFMFGITAAVTNDYLKWMAMFVLWLFFGPYLYSTTATLERVRKPNCTNGDA